MTRHNYWALSLSNEFCSLGDSSRRRLVNLPRIKVRVRVGKWYRTIEHFAHLHIFGNVDQYRPGTTATGKTECFMHDIRQVFNSLYQEIVLGDRLGHTEYIGLLECVATDERACHLPGNCHQRRRVHVGSSKPGNEVRSTGTTGRYTYAHFAGGASIAIGSMSCRLLVAHKYVMQGG